VLFDIVAFSSRKLVFDFGAIVPRPLSSLNAAVSFWFGFSKASETKGRQ
jgi:hypothetical protein